MPDKLKLACLAAGFPGLSREDLTQALSLERKRCGSRGHQRRSHTHTRQGPGSKGWRDLATAGASAPLKPQFRPGGTSQGAQLDPADFPAALLLGSSQDPGGPKSAAGHGAPPRPHGSPWRDAGAAGPGPGSSGSLWSTQRAGRGARHLHPVSDPVQPAARALAPAQAAAAESAVGVAQLAAQHPWAGAELAGLVLRAAGGELDVAGALLLDMAPASGGSSRGRSSDSGQRAPDAAAAALVGSSRHGAPASPSSSSIGQAAMDETGEGESEVGDVYYQYRIQATLLTKQWLRAARGACAAYAAGDHSAARRLAAEGRRLRQESLAAHAEAAERIEGHNNASTSLFEIDLHGLHAAEAVAALERRLRLLADMAADLAGCTGGLGPVPAVLDGARPPGSRQASAAAGGPPGPGGVLRVVVGRGSHSRGGDASLPRVVERHLRERGFGLAARAGALDVLLGRRFGVRL